MRYIFLCVLSSAALAAVTLCGGEAAERHQPLVADHTCIGIGAIPDSVVGHTRDTLKYHFAHTSHGSQLRDGLSVLENDNPRYEYAYENNTLPVQEFLIRNPPETG